MTPLQKLHGRIAACMDCPLGQPESETFHHVPGEGPEDARVMTGRPFVGRSGNLLTEILTAAGLKREEIFITSVCKCRPPQNRTPKRAEMAACLPWLTAQIELIRPEVVLTVGNVGTQTLLNTKTGINALRGRFHQFTLGERTMTLRPLFHPAYLLRNPRRVPGSPWEMMLNDLIEVRQLLE